MAGFWDGVRAIAARRRAEALDAAGHRQEAFAAFSEAAVFWERTNPVLAASLWSRASRQMAMVENRPAQLEASRRALDLLPPWQHWKISLAREFGQLALQICADALYWLDQLSEAESVALEAIAAAESFGTPWEMAGAYGVYSQALLRQDRPVQTLGAATRTVEIARTIGEPAFTATALTDHASALLPLAQYTAARKDVEEALALLGTLDGGPQHDQARIGSLAAAASVYRMTGDHERAMALADQAAQLCDLRGRREQYLQARMAWSLAAAEGGEHDRAAACAREVYEEAKQRDLRHVAGLAANNLAVIDARAGNLTRARAWSRRAMRLQDAEDLATRGAARCNLGFLSMIGGDFAAAQTDLLGAIDDWEALRRNVTDDRQYVDVLEEQARVYRALQTVRLALGDTEGALEAAERARGRGLLRRLRSREPEAGNPLMAGFTAGEAVALAAARKAGFLVYSAVSPASEPGEENSVAGLHAWYIDETGIAHASVGVQALTDLGLHTREDPFFGVTRDLQAPEQSDHEGMAEVELLSELLVRPLAQALARTPARLLVVVPDGELDRVPFAALRLGPGDCLADRWPVTIVPAIALYAELETRTLPPAPPGQPPESRARPAPAGAPPDGRALPPPPGAPLDGRARPAPAGAPPEGRAQPAPLEGRARPALLEVLLVGNPALPVTPIAPGFPVPSLALLAHAEREANQIAACYGATALVGAAATRAAVLSRLPGCDLAHFATHGLYGSDDGVTPGALCLSPHGGDDGYLRADDVSTLDLRRCRVVLLSACQTGWGRSTHEGSLGLARAFLHAGVRAVVVSLWPVDDAATADLMIAFHQRLRRGAAVGEALRAVMREARDTGVPVAHWASFTVVGDARVTVVPAEDPQTEEG